MALNRYFGETVYETPPLIRRRTDQTPHILKAPDQTVFSVAEKNGDFNCPRNSYGTKAGESAPRRRRRRRSSHFAAAPAGHFPVRRILLTRSRFNWSDSPKIGKPEKAKKQNNYEIIK